VGAAQNKALICGAIMCGELATGYNFSSFVALHVIYKLFCMLLIRSSWTSATLSLKTEEYQS